MGIQAELRGSAEQLLSPNELVIFDGSLSDTANGISYDNAGIFTISRNGRFLINWWVSVSGATALPINFSLNVNGVSHSIGSSLLIEDQISGSAILVVDSAPVTVSLTNDTGGIVVLADTPVQANIVITGWAI